MSHAHREVAPMHRLVRSGLFAGLLLLSLAATAAAKGDGMAALDTPIPPGAEPGTPIDVGWRAWTPDGATEWPFTGSPMFIRLTSVGGSETVEAMGRERPSGSGHYTATITVPAGGVGLVEIGLLGESCVEGACSRSDIMFDLPEDQRLPQLAAGDPASDRQQPAASTPPASVPIAVATIAAGVIGLLVMALARRARTAGVASRAHADGAMEVPRG